MQSNEIKKILVPIDFSETGTNALNEAIKLSGMFEAELYLIHVVESLVGYVSVYDDMPQYLPSRLELSLIVKDKMEALKLHISKDFDIIPQIKIGEGEIYSEIIAFSELEKIDLIVMGTHGISGYKELFLGSNAQRVVSLSEIPVLTMQKPCKEIDFKNILIPIDNATHSREKVNITLMIAKLFDAKIHLLGLLDSDEEEEQNKFSIKLDSVEENIIASKLDYVKSIVIGDNIAETTKKYATKNHCDLIAINTGHESRLTGIFMGLFAQQIVNHSKIPVLSFKHHSGHFIIETPGYGIS
jgi:nucleotide-binding universal stress UspA family protein